MIVIAGLGNPTSKYKGTRHNVGFEVIDMLADRYNIRVKDKKHQALCGTGLIEGQKVLLVKPQTFMNLSGESIGAILNFYKLESIFNSWTYSILGTRCLSILLDSVESFYATRSIFPY